MCCVQAACVCLGQLARCVPRAFADHWVLFVPSGMMSRVFIV